MNKQDLVIFQSKEGDVRINVELLDETVWLDQSSIATLFNVNRPAITKHINNIFKQGELLENSVCSKMERTASDGKVYSTKLYNLDMIISVGYRVNSSKATQFRIWATNILRNHIIEGYTINQQRLEQDVNKFKQLQFQLNNLRGVLDSKHLTNTQSKSLIRVITDYSKALELIDLVDRDNIPKVRGIKQIKSLEYTLFAEDIVELRKSLNAGELFGKDNKNGLEGIIKSIEQTFDNKPVYGNVESKAANLLYLIIKNHPFIDGNKRIGSFAFIRYLDLNNILYRDDGSKRIDQDTLVAIALLIANSNTKDKDIMISLVKYLIELE